MNKYIKIEEIKLSINEDEKLLKNKIVKILWIKKDDLIKYKVIKKAIDSRNKNNILFIYSVYVNIKNQDTFFSNKNKFPNFLKTNIKKHRIKLEEEFVYKINRISSKPKYRPIIIWTWPAWLYAWLIISEAWLNPIIIERWKDVDSRIKDVDIFSNTWKLNTESNIQFWEWWAGTFSDWKLYTLINDPRSKYVFEELVKAWAPEKILYDAKPHVWTDYLRILVKNIRKKIISLWWEIKFNSCLTDIKTKNNEIQSIIINNNEELKTNDLIIAIWHSARDTVTMLYEKWLEMKAKPYAMWVRIEHSAEMINKSQYWESCVNPKLETARYKLVNHDKEERSVYSFCMCPGWYVMAASSEENRLCVNWMSEYAQDSWISNSALLIPVKVEDFWSNNPLAWIEFQRKYEEKAFIAWWNNYHAPAQLVWDFLAWKPSTKLWKIKPTYKPWIKLTSLDECLPKFIIKALKKSLPILDRKIKWFASHDAILTAIEARSSSVVTMQRDKETFESNIKWLYPCWEWAWFAWWITSSAIDWLKVAESIIEKYV